MRYRMLAAIFLTLTSLNAFAADTTGTGSTTETTGTGTTETTGTGGAGGTSGAGGGSSTELLQQIANNTLNTLNAVNNVPTYLNAITQQAMSWLALEDSESSYITSKQGDFASFGNFLSQGSADQSNIQKQVAASLLGVSVADLTTPVNAPKAVETIPYINDISYGTLIGQPIVPSAPSNPVSYAANALGVAVPHFSPSGLSGPVLYRVAYSGYYKSVMAANSFGSYALSGIIADNQNGGQLLTLQNKLITAASESSWLARIATEDLGKVLRQILLFQSQQYILMIKSIELQKQLLTAQVLTNSLLIATNVGSESELYAKASGAKQ